MNLHLSRRNLLIFILLLVLIICGSIGFYLLKIDPLKKQIQITESNLVTQEKLLATIVENSKKEEQSVKSVYENSTELQKKIPVDPLLGQFLLDIEEAEVRSGSVISNMSFSESDVIAPEGQNVPVGIKRITVKMNVRAPDFYGLVGFLESVEDMERITKVDSISFTGPTERKTIESPGAIQGLTFPIVISTFYFPALQELADELPKRYSPEPSNKLSPLAEPSTFDSGIKKDSAVEVIKPLPEGDKKTEKLTPKSKEEVKMKIEQKVEPPVDEKKEEQAEQPLQEPDQEAQGKTGEKESDYKVINHKVKEGETLYSISIKYYRSRKGEDIIQRWNNLPNNTVFVGQVLKIPLEK